MASDRVEDVDDALSVIHDGFVEAGYLAPQASGRRMHASYLNPGTIFFVARMEGEAVGDLRARSPTARSGCPPTAPSPRRTMRSGRRATTRCARPDRSSIRSAHRRSTRRIVMRLFAAMTRVALGEFPDAPVPMAVAPENERFYAIARRRAAARRRAPALRRARGAAADRRRGAGRALRAAGDAEPAPDARPHHRAEPVVADRPADAPRAAARGGSRRWWRSRGSRRPSPRRSSCSPSGIRKRSPGSSAGPGRRWSRRRSARRGAGPHCSGASPTLPIPDL